VNNLMNEAFVDTREPWSAEEFETLLRGKSSSYHINHPFHVMMAQGKLNAAQLRGWVANRFYYQISIPLKDAARCHITSVCGTSESVCGGCLCELRPPAALARSCGVESHRIVCAAHSSAAY